MTVVNTYFYILTPFLHTAYIWWCIIRAKHFVLISTCPCWSQLYKIIKNCLNLQININIIYKHKLNIPKCPVTNPLHRTSGRAIFPTGNHGSSVWHTDHRSPGTDPWHKRHRRACGCSQWRFNLDPDDCYLWLEHNVWKDRPFISECTYLTSNLWYVSYVPTRTVRSGIFNRY
jgi:hypothetical protein